MLMKYLKIMTRFLVITMKKLKKQKAIIFLREKYGKEKKTN